MDNKENKWAFVYCHFDNSRKYDDFQFHFQAIQRLKYIQDNPEVFRGFDIVFVIDPATIKRMETMCRQEDIDLSKLNVVFKRFPEVENIENKMIYTTLRFTEFANPKYDVVWMKDLDHTLDINDVEMFKKFIDSDYDYASIPNTHVALKIPNVGDLGFKTFKFRDIFNQNFVDEILHVISVQSSKMLYGFDLRWLTNYLTNRFGGQESLMKNMLFFIVDDWRLRHFKEFDVDLNKENYVMFPLLRISIPILKYEDRPHKTYVLSGVERSYVICDDYRGFSLKKYQ